MNKDEYIRIQGTTVTRNTVLGHIVTDDSNVLVVHTIVTTPAEVVAVADELLRAAAAQIIEPNPTRSPTVRVLCRPANTTAVSTFMQRFSLLHQQNATDINSQGDVYCGAKFALGQRHTRHYKCCCFFLERGASTEDVHTVDQHISK